MNGFGLEVLGLKKRFGESNVLADVTIRLEQGQILGLLGPSGCGKTTTLRCIAGLETPTSGQIFIGGHKVCGTGKSLPPEERDIGMVFQSYALWPHMSVYDNIAMPLQLKKVPRGQIKDRVEEVMRLVGLQGLAGRFPSQLSGGQQQRVAVARAVVKEPKLLLFDEPLSNLDARLRDQVRVELRELLTRLGLTAVFVTHDQTEAMTLCDQIALMEGGRLVQAGSPEELYDQPNSRFVAGFMGNANLLGGRLLTLTGDGYGQVQIDSGQVLWSRTAPNLAPGQRVALVARPEAFLTALGDERKDRLEVTVIRQIYLGGRREWLVKAGAAPLRVELDARVNLGGPRDAAVLFCDAKSLYCISDEMASPESDQAMAALHAGG